MGEFDNTLGALSIGYVVASILFGIMSVQSFRYFQVFAKDPVQLKVLVAGLWILDTLQLFFIGDALYFWMVSNYANPKSLADSTWSFNMGIFTTNSIVLIVEMFFAYRVFTVSKNVWLALVIATLSLCYWGFELATLIRTFQLVKVELFFEFQWIASTGLACAAVADLLIAASLSFYLHQSRTGIKTTDSVINKLLLYAINTGLLTSVFALIDMICFLTMPSNLIHIAFNLMIGKLYTNSLLASLNVRTSLRSELQNHTSYTMSSFQAARQASAPSSKGQSTTVDVARTIDVHTDYVDFESTHTSSFKH
ncbi:hypothetical protein K435DRAFT_962341 [Dendrothele bispora CBS 962.96]|uniref:DUF6534 domain-containing protein n=1 Tax=Dendrothele bispora (strain CBS 962.96) TaxID=1314807 RepID=A0A4V4HHQ3_DENBC|nr:hypothetical protein K435DRAFT_962341 [Dendrothele bispora CBS 962.96]